MAFWLVKSEPSTYSFARFVQEKRTQWDGVRNHQAAANLRAMKKGDRCFFYHSGETREIVGTAEVIRNAIADPKDPTGRFVMVELAAGRALAHPVTLAAIKAEAQLADFALVRQSRLSVVPVGDAQWKHILEMSKTA